ncbi:Probable RNA-directed DNA polymerase from transposon BS [Eumeta japonica]|uniref:Probable RNA-directed DNA polymerase from transposon BS n=1 Tax=Eumeta variegata TaxID=151549 RepID=A0A4C1XZC7_EUMVA|nr:Probable RNA-directed DNA polymerase from transposon BS [Eumeta japonica]
MQLVLIGRRLFPEQQRPVFPGSWARGALQEDRVSGGVPKGPVTRALIKDIVAKSLSEMGYKCPETELDKFVKTATPVASRATTPASIANSSRAHSPASKSRKLIRKRAASSSSEEDTASSDSTVVGSDDESGSGTNTWDSGSAEGSSRSRANSNSDGSFSLVKRKNKKAIRKAVKKSKLTEQPTPIVMDVEVAQAPSSMAPAIPVATPTQVATDRAAPRFGTKPSAPPNAKAPPPPIFLRKGANFVKISADCTRLHINYSKAVRVADDGIKIICPNVETFRSLNKYLVDSKVQFHTYALEEERKVKAVIRSIPVDFALDDIKNGLVNQGFPVLSVHRMSRRDGSPLWMVLAIPERTVESKKIFNALSVVCSLSGIRVEALFKKGGPGQCHRCQKYGHAAANCHADPPLCQMSGPTLDQRVPAHSGVGGETLLFSRGFPGIWKTSGHSRHVGRKTTPVVNSVPPRTLLQPVGEEIRPSRKAFWEITKALKTKGYTPILPLKRPDGTTALDDADVAECIADSIETQCSHVSPPHDIAHINSIEEEVLQKASLEPKDDLTPVSLSEVQLLVKSLKTRKAPGLDGVSNKAIKCFSQPLLSLLVAIFNACLQNCYFPSAWKEAEVIGIHKPGKSRDLPASYRPISLLTDLAKLFERVLKTRLSNHLFGKGLIIDEQFGFRPAHSCPQQVLRLVEYVTEGFKTKQKNRSALSPFLYSAYTNDIPRPTSGVQLTLFADDTALYFRSRTRLSIFRHLPKAIDELGQWFRKWRIEGNPDKSAAIQFKYSKNRSKLVVDWNTPNLKVLNARILWQ